MSTLEIDAGTERNISSDSDALKPPNRGGRTEAIQRFGLNPRQVKLLDLLAEGVRDKTAADALGISEVAEHKAVQKIFKKLKNVRPERSRVAVAVYWKEVGREERDQGL